MAEHVKACEISDGASRLECPPINLIYSHYHNAIRSELSRLTTNTNELESLPHGRLVGHLQDLKTQFRFLEKIYKYHSSVEDEVRCPKRMCISEVYIHFCGLDHDVSMIRQFLPHLHLVQELKVE